METRVVTIQCHYQVCGTSDYFHNVNVHLFSTGRKQHWNRGSFFSHKSIFVLVTSVGCYFTEWTEESKLQVDSIDRCESVD